MNRRLANIVAGCILAFYATLLALAATSLVLTVLIELLRWAME